MTASEHPGDELGVHGPHELNAKDTAELARSAQPAVELHEAPPQRGEAHPPEPAQRLPSAPPGASEALHDSGGAGAGLGPTTPTPNPTASWQATLTGKGGYPADAQISVSTTHVVVTNRQVLRYYDRSGTPVGGEIGSNTFFTAGLNLKDAAGNTIDVFNDLRTIFDPYRKRFWVTAYAYYSGAAKVPPAKQRSYIPIAVSKTQNPLDGWWFYWWDAAAQQGQSGSSIWQPGDVPDYPIIGIDKEAVTITHAVNNGSFRYWHVTLTPAGPLSTGTGASGWQFWDLQNPDGSVPWCIAPAVHHGSPKGGRAYWLGRQGTDEVVVWAITHPFDSARKVQATAVTVQGYADPVNGQQKGSSKRIKFTNLGNAIAKACFRNEFVHGVANDAHDWGSIGKVRTSIHYVRLPVGSFPKVSSPPAGGGVDRVFGGGNVNEKLGGLKHYGWCSVEANKNGDAILGYARTGEQLFPEMRASAYMHNESDIRPSVQVKAGDKAADNPGITGANAILPWGDTSGACVDPTDDTAIWVAQEYASKTADGNGNYDIWVAKFFS